MKDSDICRHCGHVWLAHEDPPTCGMPDCDCDNFEKMYVMRLWGGRYVEVIAKRRVEREYAETGAERSKREKLGIKKPEPMRYTAVITKKIPNFGYLLPKSRGSSSSS